MVFSRSSISESLRKLSDGFVPPGMRPGRKFNPPAKQIRAYLNKLEQSEWPKAYAAITEHIAAHLRSGKPLSLGFKVLSEVLAEQAYATGDFALIERHFIWPNDPYSGDVQDVRAQTFMSMAFFRYLGEDVERSVTFCAWWLDYTAKEQERFLQAGASPDAINDRRSIADILTVMYSLSAPVMKNMPQKLWFVNLLEASKAGDTRAKRCLDGVLELVWFIWRDVPVYSQSEHDLWFGVPDMQRAFEPVPEDIRTYAMKIIVPDGLEKPIKTFFAKRSEELSTVQRQKETFVAWFNRHMPEIAAAFDRKVWEIEHTPRYGLRPFGYDSVLIRLSVLYGEGISSIAFFPEGEQFPNVKVQVNCRTFGHRLSQIWTFFRNATLEKAEVIFLQHDPLYAQFLITVMEFAVLDALHRIICREPSKNLAGETTTRSAIVHHGEPNRQVVVRPFLRRLPAGYHASDAALEQAFLQMGWKLPDGVTFVQSHDRWVGLPAERPAPLFTYTDETFRETIA